MIIESATEVRKEWSSVIDSVVHDKPKFVKRTRDCILLSNIEVIKNILEAYHFTAEKFIETDNSITLSLNEIDLIENAETEKETRLKLGKAILEYSNDYYNEFSFWSSAPNRKNHMPYVMKALIIDNAEKIGDSVQCLDGKN